MKQGPLVYEEELTEEDTLDFYWLFNAVVNPEEQEDAIALIKVKPYLCCFALPDKGNLSTPLIRAVCSSRACCSEELFRSIINNPYTDLNAQNQYGYSPLHFLAMNNRWELLKIFLTEKKDKLKLDLLTFDVPQDNDSGFSSVYLASDQGSIEALHLLLEAGADNSLATGKVKWTPLHAASFKAHEECVLTLLKNGANPDAVDAAGDAPLMVLGVAQNISHETFEKIQRLFKDAESNFSVKNAKGFSIDELAEHSSHPDALEFSRSLKSNRAPSLAALARKALPQGTQLPEHLTKRFGSMAINK